MKQHLVSIIIPTYNRVNLIGETLNSIINQTYVNWECIVIDDGSTDNTCEVLKTYSGKDNRIQHYNRPENILKGANSCRNYGFELSKGEFIIFLDDDDLLANEALTLRVEAMQKNQDIDGAVFTTQEFNKIMGDNKNILNRDIGNPSRYNYLNSFLLGKFNWTIMSPIWRRGILKNPVFDAGLKRFQDVDFHINQLFKEHIKIKRFYIVDNYCRMHKKPKAENVVFRSNVGYSFITIFKKHISKIQSDKVFTKSFKRYVYVVFTRFIVPNKISDYNLYLAFRKEVLEHKILSKKERFLFKIQEFISFYTLTKFTGFGFFKLEQNIKKYYNY